MPDERASAWPLTEAQAGLWFAQRLDPQNPVFNTGQYVAITGALDVAAFISAVEATMAEADALAVRIEERDGEPWQVVDPHRRTGLAIVDLRADANPEGAARQDIDRDLATPLDVSSDPLVVQRLYILGETSYWWYLRVHHLLIDGYGTSLLTDRIAEHYSARVGGPGPSSRPLGTLAALAAADVAYRESTARSADREFWQAWFADAPAATSLTAGVAMTGRRYFQRHIELPPDVGPALGRLAETTRTSWPDLLTARAT